MAWWQFWKKDPPPQKPQLGIFRSGQRDDLSIDIAARRLTPERLGAILREAERGNIRRQSEMFEQLETDPHIFSVMDNRKRAAASKDFILKPGRGDEKKALIAVEDCLELIDGLEDWEENLLDMHDAIGKAFSVSQILWEPDGNRIKVAGLDWWPQREFTLDRERPDILRVLTDNERTKGEPLLPYQWIVHRYKARSVPLSQAGLFRVVAWMYLFKHFAVRDWVIFSEAYGMPRRRGTYPRGSSEEERDRLIEAVYNLGKDGAAVIPEGFSLDFLEAQYSKGGQPQPALAEFCNGEISKAVVGQTLTTESGSRGARSLGEVHERVKQILTLADCKAVAKTLRRDLFTPYILFNRGPDFPIPSIEFLVREDEDLLKRAQRDEILQRMGYDISKDYITETYSTREAKSDDDRLRRAA